MRLWKNAAGLRLERLLEAAGGEAVARAAIVFFSASVRFGRNDVEEQHLEAGVGEVGGDAAAHDARADDACAANRDRHWNRLRVIEDLLWLLPWTWRLG